jgi:hypothetical protein
LHLWWGPWSSNHALFLSSARHSVSQSKRPQLFTSISLVVDFVARIVKNRLLSASKG